MRQSGRRRPLWQQVALHAVLTVLSALFLMPLVWLVGSSLKTDEQIRAFPPEWLPDMPFYSARSPYLDLDAFEKAVADGTTAKKAREIAKRQLAIGLIFFQGESRTLNETSGAIEPKSAFGEGVTIRAETVAGRRAWLLSYEDRGHRTCGKARLELPWTDSLGGFRNVTLQLHGDRSWRDVIVNIVTPEGALRTERAVRLSFAGWQDIVLIRQETGAIPWGTYRLISGDKRGRGRTVRLERRVHDVITSGPQRGNGGREVVNAAGRPKVATLTLEIGSASRLRVILRKLLNNYPSGLTFIPFGRYLLNTLIICVLVVAGTLLSCSLVAYGLARVRWRGRNALFYVIIATMMLPFQVTMVPLFVVFARLGWVDTFLPLTVPAFFGNAFFIFLLRQFFLTIPDELSDAARIDGCREWDIYWRIVLPLAKPALATVGLFAFMNTWNDYVGPLIYLSDASKYTLTLGLATFSSQYGSYPGMLMAVTAVMTLPIILLFFLTQRTFIQGIALTGIKG